MDTPDQPILLVDDDASDIELTRWAFKNSGFTTEMVVARDGLEALDLLLPSGGGVPLDPVMVLMDMDMPRMGGVETVQRLRADPRTQIVPVIMLTTSVAQRDIMAASNAGANGYVQKPLDIEDFLKSSPPWAPSGSICTAPRAPPAAQSISCAPARHKPPALPTHSARPARSSADRSSPGLGVHPAPFNPRISQQASHLRKGHRQSKGDHHHGCQPAPTADPAGRR